VMLALYIYASSYEKPVKCCCLFPIYAFLLWIVRLQYIVVAIAICLCSAFFSHSEDTKRDNVGRIMAIGVIIICCLFAFTKIDLSSYISQDLNFDVYMGNTSYDILSLFKRFIISFLPYFPVTHLFDDPHWSYGLAGALQIPINLSLIAILVSDLYRNRRLVEIIKNPLIISIMIFYMSGFLSAVHVTYISVGMPLMAIVYQDYEKSKYRKYIFAFFILYVVSSLIYEILGLRGSGMLFFG
ncbi:MAG TPA: hypothetical protein PLJ83_12950, partial [Spirochaetales bacterium]|nr:hypothetical protein [Spirochaetales bacterium]